MNGKVSDFMMFYNDEDNMGAVKATLYNAGDVLIYVYGEQGKTIVKEINTFLDVEKEDILSSLTALGAVSLSDQRKTLEKMSGLFGGSDSNWIEVDFGF